jgi:tRNA (cytidine/uridine-2'-O-)-methyltransferase
LVDLRLWSNWLSFRQGRSIGRLIGTSASYGRHFNQYRAEANDNFIFGPETSGLPLEIMDRCDFVYRVPLKTGVRSLNLATTVGFFMGLALSYLQAQEL